MITAAFYQAWYRDFGPRESCYTRIFLKYHQSLCFARMLGAQKQMRDNQKVVWAEF
jgi:hypothetical protein